MSSKLSPMFKRHLSFFASPKKPHHLTFLSSLKSSLSLGLNFPVSLFLAIALRIMYSPSYLLLTPPDLTQLQTSRTQLEHAELRQSTYTCSDLLRMAPPGSGLFDQGHIVGMWALAADTQSGLVQKCDVESFQTGALLEELSERRRIGREPSNVIPFLRGGPGSVAGHSWLVGKLFGVRVYENETKKSP